MKKLVYLASMVSFALIFASCHTSRNMQKETLQTAVMGRTIPSQLESYAGNIDFDYVMDFVPGEFGRSTVMKITPKMQYGNSVVALNPIYLQGENVKNSTYPTIPSNKATTYSRPMHINYVPGMENAQLWAEIETMDRNRNVQLEPVILNNGVHVWQQQPLVIDGVSYVPIMVQNEIDSIPVECVGCVGCCINFPISKATISPQEQQNATMQQAESMITKIMAQKGAQISKVVIVVSTSPDGSEFGNSKLTNNRYSAAKACFMKDLNLEKCSMSKQKGFVSDNLINENWSGLYELLDISSIPNKVAMIQSLKAIKDSNARSMKLLSYIKQYPEIKNNILPALRKADCYVFYTVPQNMPEQVVTYAPQLQTMAMTPPSDWMALNDLAVIALQNKHYRKARKLLESAVIIQKGNEIVYNNLGVACANMGDTLRAIDMLSKAQIRKEAKYNMGVLLAMSGNPHKAITYLKSKPDCLLGYCQLQAGDNNNALATLKNAPKKSPGDYYLLAVAAARCNDPATMTKALSTATKNSPQTKHKAKRDMEFYTYRKMPDFTTIVN